MAEDLFQSLAEHRLIEALSQLPENYLLKSPTIFQQNQLLEREKKRLALTGGDGPNNNNNKPRKLPENPTGKVRQMFDERRRGIGIDRSQPLKPIASMAGSTKNLNYDHNDNNNVYSMKNGLSVNNIQNVTRRTKPIANGFITNTNINNNNVSHSRRSQSTVNNNVMSTRNSFQRKSAQPNKEANDESITKNSLEFSTQRIPSGSKANSRYASQSRQSKRDIPPNLLKKDMLSKSITTLNLNSNINGDRINNKYSYLKYDGCPLEKQKIDKPKYDSQSINGVAMKLNPVVTKKSPNYASSTYSGRSRISVSSGRSLNTNDTLLSLRISSEEYNYPISNTMSLSVSEKQTSPRSLTRKSTQLFKSRANSKIRGNSESTQRTMSMSENGEHEVKSVMGTCQFCHRHFNVDRLGKHEAVCKRMMNTKRKVFDASKHRVRGTEAEKYIKKQSQTQRYTQQAHGGRNQGQLAMRYSSAAAANNLQMEPNPAVRKSNWRKKHEEFITAIREAKKVQEHLARGGKLSDLPPPPPSENPDYIQCPHCLRRFNEAAAERHIPKCANMKHNKPKPQQQAAPLKRR